MKLTLKVEPSGWAWLKVEHSQVTLSLHVSVMADVLTNVVAVIADVAGGAESASTILGLEPGEAAFQIKRGDMGWSTLRLEITALHGSGGAFDFRVETDRLAGIGLGLAASVDRDVYLESWAPNGTCRLTRWTASAACDGAGPQTEGFTPLRLAGVAAARSLPHRPGPTPPARTARTARRRGRGVLLASALGVA